MKSKLIYIQLFLLIVTIFFLVSCKKKAGPGGQASVIGKVYAYDYDNTFNYLVSKGYSSGTKVYIVYGDEKNIGNTITTSIDGTFEFKYLNKGHYKVYALSVDTAYRVKGNDTENPVIKEFDIKEKKQKVTLDDIIINK
ncbi:MAG: hypothetical protein K0S53_423 [Bacteroidetes bacterium]|jgi:hypothetical protein|nr:hypothetical protein [Bacteroidota bacterium]MDF2451860.1 hypothetical protein [Bacteroidota bacterium]